MLKTLFAINKPFTIFDPRNAEHRRAYYEFHNNKTWGNCHFRFLIEEPYNNLIDCVQNKMLSYYLGKEFEKGRKSIHALTK